MPSRPSPVPAPLSLATDRLQLTELTLGDAPFILELLNEPDFIRNIADKGVRDIAGAEGYLLNGPMASYAKHGFGMYRVSLKESGEPIGMSGLIRRDVLDQPDLGYAFLARHHRRGYASEAGAAVLAHARSRLKLATIVAITALDNVGSIRVLEGLGFREQGVLELADHDEPSRYFVSDGIAVDD